MWASALAARAPLRKVGPRLMVMLENQIMKRPKETHCGLSFRRERVSSVSSSGRMGASLRTVVRRLTVETVTRRRKVVSTRAHLLMASHRNIDLPMGSRMAARAQSTTAWWNIRPWLHLQHHWSVLQPLTAQDKVALYQIKSGEWSALIGPDSPDTVL